VADSALTRRSLTALRHFIVKNSHAGILLGGRRVGFQGALPGVMEEALIALKNGRPLYLVGGFGGVTLEILRALGVEKSEWLPPLPDAARDQKRAQTDTRRTFCR
jgi:hypothetical protein